MTTTPDLCGIRCDGKRITKKGCLGKPGQPFWCFWKGKKGRSGAAGLVGLLDLVHLRVGDP